MREKKSNGVRLMWMNEFLHSRVVASAVEIPWSSRERSLKVKLERVSVRHSSNNLVDKVHVQRGMRYVAQLLVQSGDELWSPGVSVGVHWGDEGRSKRKPQSGWP